MSVLNLRKSATENRRRAIAFVGYARERLIRAKRAMVTNEEHRDLIVSEAKASALYYLLQANACRARACDLTTEYRARMAFGRSCCESCSGAGRGHSRHGEWICSPCMGFGQIRGAA